MESPYLSPNPISNTLSSSDCSSDMSQLSTNAPKSTERKSTKKIISSFIQKLYNILEENTHGHLISWNPSGTSFSVCNAKLFASQVLPAYFKHSNFSSFVRLLNMYGFHKVGKSSRSQRSTDMEVWEFSHPKLIRGRPDLLKLIKRKTMDSEMIRRETSDMQASFSALQTSQNDLLQQFYALQENLGHLHHALEESKKAQQYQGMQIHQLLAQRGISNNNDNSNIDMYHNSQPSPPLTHYHPSLSSQNNSYSIHQPKLEEPFRMTVTTPPTSNTNDHDYSSHSNTYWTHNPMTHLSTSQYHKMQEQQQPLYSPMTLNTAINTPLPPSPNPEISPGSSVDSHGSYSFDFGYSNTLDLV